MCSAWIARGLIAHGYAPEDENTREIVERWRDSPVEACSEGNSAAYLRDTGQLEDLDFILQYVDDLRAVYMVKHDEVVEIAVS